MSTQPCQNCPFRNNGNGVSLRKGRATEIIKDVLQDRYFSCHKHVHNNAPNPVCRGALTMLDKQGTSLFRLQHVRMAANLGMWEPDTNHDLVWDNLKQMEDNAR